MQESRIDRYIVCVDIGFTSYQQFDDRKMSLSARDREYEGANLYVRAAISSIEYTHSRRECAGHPHT